MPIIVGSQLSRAIEAKGDYKFRLSDLRESGVLEQNADKVSYLHQPAAHGVTQDTEGNDVSQVAELHLVKHKDGETGKLNLRFSGEKCFSPNCSI